MKGETELYYGLYIYEINLILKSK